MTEEEINEIIAEYMDHRVIVNNIYEQQFVGKGANTFVSTLYTESLDALIPVINKLKLFGLKIIKHEDSKQYSVDLARYEPSYLESYIVSDSLSNALATACAEVIKEMK